MDNMNNIEREEEEVIDLVSVYSQKLRNSIENMLSNKAEEDLVNPNSGLLNDIKNSLNNIFESKCTEIIYTRNTDKPFFGINISLIIDSRVASSILMDDIDINICNYKLEFDSKLFESNFETDEILAYLLYEVSSVANNTIESVDELRTLINLNIVADDDYMNYRAAGKYMPLLIFGFKDTINKLRSIKYEEKFGHIKYNPIIEKCELQMTALSVKNKIDSIIGELDKRVIILEWILVMFKNMDINCRLVVETLRDAKDCTGSRLLISEINNIIKLVEHPNLEKMEESVNLVKFIESAHMSTVLESSLFGSLRKNGLRGIENDLYEYATRVKNCEEEDDAYLIIRGINNRLGILEDYLINEKLSDSERAHWEDVAMQYRELRIIISKKKFARKQFGIYFDYSKLDDLDKI